MAALGFTQTEAGAAGYLPEDPTELAAILADHGLNLLGGFVPLVLHNRDEREVTLASVHDTAAMFRDAGATYFVTAAVTTWDWAPRTPLSRGSNAERFVDTPTGSDCPARSRWSRRPCRHRSTSGCLWQGGERSRPPTQE